MMDWSKLKSGVGRAVAAVRSVPWRAGLAHWPWSVRLGGTVLAVVLYYGIGCAWVNRVDTNPVFQDSSAVVPAHYSRAILAASHLTLREVDQHHWTPADPFFLPGWLLSAMPRFQQGLVAAVGQFAETLTVLDGGSDQDLMQAAGLYKYPATVWRVASGVAWLPTAPSSRQYRLAAHGLEDYDNNLARLDQPNVVQQVNGLQAMLDAAGADLGSLVDRLDRHLDGEPSALFDAQGRDMFHSGRGHAYAWGILLVELGKDDGDMIAARGLTSQWRRLTDTLLKAAAVDPVMVTAGDGLLANHLSQQGFALLRARLLISEIRAGLTPVN